jgi:hypothetical protein
MIVWPMEGWNFKQWSYEGYVWLTAGFFIKEMENENLG